MPPARLRLQRRHLDAVVAQARASAGREIVGLLGGRGETVMGVYPVHNNSPEPTVRFEMNDKSFVDAHLDIERRGWELVAIYHSHPVGAGSYPSPTDIANANYPDALNLILSIGENGQPVVRVFQIMDGRVREVALEVVPDEA